MSHEEGNVRTTIIALGDKLPKVETADPLACSGPGNVFSISPSVGKPGSWEIKSPSIQGWRVQASQIDINEEWIIFVDKLSLLQQRQCFAPGLGVYAIQRLISRAIPFPADRALLFAYSFGNDGFVDLESGLQIRIEKNVPSKNIFSLQQFDVVAAAGGIKLKPSRRSLFHPSDREADLLQTVRFFQASPFLRLFLQQAATESGRSRPPMLLAALDTKDLTEATQHISDKGVSACANPSAKVTCIVFADNGVSILASIVVNNRAHFYAPGTTLEQILDGLPEKEYGKALATVAVERPSGHGLYAHVNFRRSSESFRLLILLSGDRVSWSS